MKKLVTLFLACLTLCTVQAQYSVGDPYEKDGIKSVVIYVDKTGYHGLLMTVMGMDNNKSCKENRQASVKDMEPAQEHLEAVYSLFTNDGLHNSQVVKNYCKERNVSMEKYFPNYAWAESLGEGWYIPGDTELAYYSLLIGEGLGADKTTNPRKQKVVMDQLQTHEGFENFFLPYFVWSSHIEKDPPRLKKRYHPLCLRLISGKNKKSIVWYYIFIVNHRGKASTCAVCKF